MFSSYYMPTGGKLGLVELECGHRVRVWKDDLRVDDRVNCDYCDRGVMAAGNRTVALDSPKAG